MTMDPRESAEELVGLLGEPAVDAEAEAAPETPELEEEVVAEAPEDEAEVEAEAEEEPEVETEDAEDGAEDEEEEETHKPKAKKHSVPKQRLDQEVQKRRQAEEQVKAERERAEEREKLLMEQIRRDRERFSPQQPQQPQEQEAAAPTEPPAWAEDPDGWAQWMQNRNSQLEQAVTRMHQTGQQQTQLEQVRAAAGAREQAFTQGKPDYHDAHGFLRESLQREYLMSGYTQEQVAQIIPRVELQTAHNLMQQGIDPAEYVYNMALNRGYQAPAAEAEAEDVEAAAPAAAAPETDDLTMRRKRNKAKSIGGGGRPSEAANLETASDAEFAEAMKRSGFGDFGS